jgi:solute carrier family 8 (sodium/calcium exchanger)
MHLLNFTQHATQLSIDHVLVPAILQVRIADSSSKLGFKELNIKVWNDTVANLTLMALGSSAPEILLSIIEVILNEFKAFELGPGTIVGSAAFNLLVIVGMCVISIPKGEVRTIKAIKVRPISGTGFSLTPSGQVKLCIISLCWFS